MCAIETSEIRPKYKFICSDKVITYNLFEVLKNVIHKRVHQSSAYFRPTELQHTRTFVHNVREMGLLANSEGNWTWWTMINFCTLPQECLAKAV